MKTMYHVTPISNLESVLEKGLIPQIGERAAELEEEAGVFLFATYEACEDALCNWLGEAFEEQEEEVVSLKVELPEAFVLEQAVEWEFISRTPVDAKYITFYKNEGWCAL